MYVLTYHILFVYSEPISKLIEILRSRCYIIIKIELMYMYISIVKTVKEIGSQRALSSGI
jgi:hypothetical protein